VAYLGWAVRTSYTENTTIEPCRAGKPEDRDKAGMVSFPNVFKINRLKRAGDSYGRDKPVTPSEYFLWQKGGIWSAIRLAHAGPGTSTELRQRYKKYQP